MHKWLLALIVLFACGTADESSPDLAGAGGSGGLRLAVGAGGDGGLGGGGIGGVVRGGGLLGAGGAGGDWCECPPGPVLCDHTFEIDCVAACANEARICSCSPEACISPPFGDCVSECESAKASRRAICGTIGNMFMHCLIAANDCAEFESCRRSCPF